MAEIVPDHLLSFLSFHAHPKCGSVCQIVGPDGREIFRRERESSGKYTFAAHMDGIYTYCFSNQMSTMTPKVIMFTMDIADPNAPAISPTGEGAEGTQPLSSLLRREGHGL